MMNLSLRTVDTQKKSRIKGYIFLIVYSVCLTYPTVLFIVYLTEIAKSWKLIQAFLVYLIETLKLDDFFNENLVDRQDDIND